MKRVIILLFMLFLWPVNQAHAVKVKVIEVVGSNTIKVYHNFQTKYVKLAGVDIAPSVAKKKAAMFSFRNGVDSKRALKVGQEAKSELKKLIKPGDMIEVEFEKNKNKNSKKGDTAYFYNKDGEMINNTMIEGGFGVVSKGKSKYKEQLNKTFESAKKEQTGMWDEDEEE